MNIAQKIILFIGLIVFVLAGFSALINWPENYGKGHGADISILLELLIAWIMTGVATAGLIYIVKSKNK